ncbi:MAG TPA: hypothetical protein VMV36_07180, partial [Ignavibacteriaceae bacterium]|nr:hypothetical protein [Ignavibacteriaceae bacterium]
MNFLKHLNKIEIFTFFIFASIILSGCEKEKVKKDFVARVNNSYLTKEQLSSLMAGYSGKNYYKEEV